MPIIYYSYYSYYSVNKDKPNTHQREHLLGRKLLGYGLHGLFHQLPAQAKAVADPKIDSLLSFTERGKPYLRDYPTVFFNISHSHGLAACALDDKELGIDVEKPRDFTDALINRIFTEPEKKVLYTMGSTTWLKREWFFRIWTLKEAYAKMTGEGLAVDFKAFSFTFDLSGELTDDLAGDLPRTDYKITCSNPKVSCFQKKLQGGHILSLCYTLGSGPVIMIEDPDSKHYLS